MNPLPRHRLRQQAASHSSTRGGTGRLDEDWPLGVECAWPAAIHATPAQAMMRGKVCHWQRWLAAIAF